MPDSDRYGAIKTFARRSARMTESQKRDYAELSPSLCLPFSEAALNFAGLFGNAGPVTVEIGFGNGDATAQIAESNPDANYIGIEVYRPGVARLLGEIRRRSLRNLFIVEHDALDVFEYMFLPDSVSGVHVFFPDPWPKKRHHKRRLLQRPHTDLIASRIAAGGYIRFVTDWLPYAENAKAALDDTPALVSRTAGNAGLAARPETKFERSGREAARKITELAYIKAPGSAHLA